MSHRAVALFGPSFVGKTTFLRYATRGETFARARLWTTRPRRPGEPEDPDVSFVSERSLEVRRGDPDFLLHRIGPYLYGQHRGDIRRQLSSSNVIMEVAPTTVGLYRTRLPELYTVLFWPSSFEALRSELRHSAERPTGEREQRLRWNDELEQERPEADLVVEVPRVPVGAARGALHRSIMEQILEGLRRPLGTVSAPPRR